MTHSSYSILRRPALILAALLIVPATAPIMGAAAAQAAGALSVTSGQVSGYAAADYTADSWAAFTSASSAATTLVQRRDADATQLAVAQARLRGAAAGLVMVRGLKTLVADYEQRVPSAYTAASWTPFATALTAAAAVATDAAATAPRVAAAKTALTNAAAGLQAADDGTFQTITNETFWNDTSGNPIYSQGGGIFKFGDTYYWYGVHYLGAEHYRANPTKKFDNEVTFVSIPVYSSRDLVNWKFENNVATANTALANGARLGGGWVGRLGVAFNERTGKYVLVTQSRSEVVFLQGDSPTDTFTFGSEQTQIVNSPTPGTGDQTLFTDDNGTDYLIFSNASGRASAFVSKLRDSDSLAAEPAVQIGRNSAGREGNAMFKLGGKYYMAASDLHGWNSSVAHVLESTTSNIQGTYSSEFTLPGTELDFSHVTQTGFFVTVNGTKQATTIFAGDRWADFAWNGIGYNQWMPVTKATNARPELHPVSQWQFNATTGEWRVGQANNYILNPDIQADRVITSTVTGWTNVRESGANAFVTNVSGGANGSSFALQIGAAQAFAGGVRQQVTVPAGTYQLSLSAKTSGSLSAAQVTVADSTGATRTLTIPAASAFTRRTLAGIPLAAGTATITVRAASSNGFLTVDGLGLVKTSVG